MVAEKDNLTLSFGETSEWLVCVRDQPLITYIWFGSDQPFPDRLFWLRGFAVEHLPKMWSEDVMFIVLSFAELNKILDHEMVKNLTSFTPGSPSDGPGFQWPYLALSPYLRKESGFVLRKVNP